MKKSKSALFLMELIIVIFFFALTSAVCMQVFVKAHTIDVNTQNLNNAVLWSTNAAEVFQEYGNSPETIGKTLASDKYDFDESSNIVKVYISGNYKPTTKENAVYVFCMTFSEDTRMDYLKCEYGFVDKEEAVYSLECKKRKMQNEGDKK